MQKKKTQRWIRNSDKSSVRVIINLRTLPGEQETVIRLCLMYRNPGTRGSTTTVNHTVLRSMAEAEAEGETRSFR